MASKSRRVVAAMVVVGGAVLAPVAVPAMAAAAPTAHGSINQAYVLDASKGQRLTLLDRRGETVARGSADRLGAKIFRDVKPGPGYRVRYGSKSTRRFRVLRRGENPRQSSYRKTTLKQGLNYVKMRDGVELAMTVRLPPGKTLADGPFPTVIEHSGYQIAAPKDLLSSIGGSGASDPLVPASSTFVGSVVAPQLGFATVSVQMRGSGCSGGAFDLFDLPTTYDNYDAIESVAAQKWVRGGKVGMVGISFSGITQLFAAGTQPPHLAAIAPLSVTDDTYTGTGYPGGIFNSGFAKTWITERAQNAEPAPEGGQAWAKALVKAGDKHCIANQRLRLQTQNPLKLVRENPYRTPSLFDQRATASWMSKIKVPTFLVGSFQDEQTSGHFAEAIPQLRKNKNVWITLQNGVHVDSLTPTAITRWVEFLKIYVAGEVPKVSPTILGLGPALYQLVADAPAAPLLQSTLATLPNVAAAKAAFDRYPRVRILMDNGASAAGPGSIGGAWEMDESSWPPRGSRARPWYLGSGGKLATAKPGKASSTNYVADPKARPEKTLPGDGDADAWKPQPPYTWAPLAKGKGLGFTSSPMARDLVIAGTSSVDVYVKSSARDTDIQATLSEVRPDGNETYVQSGWLRASHRKLDKRRSTATDPFPTHLKQDAAKLPRGKYVLVRVPIYPVAHVFRAGSKIRLSISAAGGDRPRWAFQTVDRGNARNTVALGGARASRLVLPVLAGATAKGTPLPGATSLRGEPNRTYQTASNGG